MNEGVDEARRLMTQAVVRWILEELLSVAHTRETLMMTHNSKTQETLFEWLEARWKEA